MRIAGIDKNDITNGKEVCVSVWFQGCPHRCIGCHNPETWDFNGGYEITYEELEKEVLEALGKNGVQRNLSFLGGEPLCEENIEYTLSLAHIVKQMYPNITIFCWTGSTYEQLVRKYGTEIFKDIDTLIDRTFYFEPKGYYITFKRE